MIEILLDPERKLPENLAIIDNVNVFVKCGPTSNSKQENSNKSKNKKETDDSKNDL